MLPAMCTNTLSMGVLSVRVHRTNVYVKVAVCKWCVTCVYYIPRARAALSTGYAQRSMDGAGAGTGAPDEEGYANAAFAESVLVSDSVRTTYGLLCALYLYFLRSVRALFRKFVCSTSSFVRRRRRRRRLP